MEIISLIISIVMIIVLGCFLAQFIKIIIQGFNESHVKPKCFACEDKGFYIGSTNLEGHTNTIRCGCQKDKPDQFVENGL